MTLLCQKRVAGAQPQPVRLSQPQVLVETLNQHMSVVGLPFPKLNSHRVSDLDGRSSLKLSSLRPPVLRSRPANRPQRFPTLT
jgi:hypothetical protein